MGHIPCREFNYSKVKEGSVVGRLIVRRKSEGRTKNGSVLWICDCSCGNTVSVQSSTLNSGLKQSCGCLEKETRNTRRSTHGSSKTREYNSWLSMRQRCEYEKAKSFEYYGGRGITVCQEWADFEVFLSDMGKCPPSMSLDRIDVNGPYCKENCRWATASVQGYNTRRHKNNTSGRTGVSWREDISKWCSVIGFEGKSIHLGTFHSMAAAVSARETAELKYFGKIKE